MFAFYNQLNPIEKKTFVLHFLYSLFEGILGGALIMNEFVFLTSLHGTKYQMGMLLQFSVLSLILAPFFYELVKYIRNKKRMLNGVALITRGPILFLLFFPHNVNTFINSYFYQQVFLGIFFMYFLSQPIIIPVVNLMLKTNYEHKNFGKLFSYSTIINKLIMLITTFLYGVILDISNSAYTYVLPIAAILSIFAVYLLANINYIESQLVFHKNWILHAFIQGYKKSFLILKNNKPYFDFEVGFMFYGISYMIAVTVVNFLFADILNLNYSSVAFYKNSYNIIVIFLLPFFGKLIGNIDPRKYAAFTYLFMFLHIVFLYATYFFRWNVEILGLQLYFFLVLSFICFGFFIATMSLLWGLGSAYFCEPTEAGDYQAVHANLTGFRGIATIWAVAIYQQSGFDGSLYYAIAFIVLAILTMMISLKYRRIEI